jgi:hypothetical protein
VPIASNDPTKPPDSATVALLTPSPIPWFPSPPLPSPRCSARDSVMSANSCK